MAELTYMKQKYLDQLIRDRGKNLHFYKNIKTSWLDNFFEISAWAGDTNIEIGDYPALLLPEGTETFDYENAKRIYSALRHLNPVQAGDARLWTYLCHHVYWEYMIARWPVEKSNLDDRYFVLRKNSRCLIRNGISRLWWFAHLSYDDKRSNPFELTKVLLSQQDIQQSFLERSFGRNRAVLHGLLDFIRLHPNKVDAIADNHKKAVQSIGKIVNKLGGATLLDSLERKEIVDFLVKTF